jgi:hypothetical protein
VEKVAGFLQVERTEETHEIVISHPALDPDEHGMTRIVFSTRYARHLANLLLEQATYAEAEATGTRPEILSQRTRKSDAGMR